MSRLDMNCFIYQLKLQHNTDKFLMWLKSVWWLWLNTVCECLVVRLISTDSQSEAVCEVSVSKPAPVLRFGDFICENANAGSKIFSFLCCTEIK